MIIGITGTIGAGKGTVVDFLVQEKGFKHFSVRSVLVKELERRELPVDRPHMREVANEMRREHGPAYVVEQLLQMALKENGDSVIESIRTVGEAELIKKNGVTLWAVDADRKTRYERIVKRWSETDKIDFETFCAHEDKEMSGTEAWDMNVAAVMRLADQTFLNNGTPEDLFAQVEEVLANMK